MKTNILTLVTIAAAILFTSCEKEIEFNGEQTDPKLVINSLIKPGQPVKASLSKSVFFLDNNGSTTAPDDVLASLYVNGNHLGELTQHTDSVWTGAYEYDEEGNLFPIFKIVTVFTNDYCPVAGDIVKITASANGFDDVEGETSPLPQFLEWSLGDSKITNLETEYYNEEEDTVWTIWGSFELTILLQDPNSNNTDFYRLWARSDNYDDYMNDSRCYITPTYDDPVFGSVVAENDFFDLNLDTAPEGVFTDVLFDGKTYSLKLPLSVYGTYRNHPDSDVFRVPIVMQHLSKEYYNYLNTCEQTDEVMQFFAEPIQTYSNVKGGFGLVGGCASDTLWFNLPLER